MIETMCRLFCKQQQKRKYTAKYANAKRDKNIFSSCSNCNSVLGSFDPNLYGNCNYNSFLYNGISITI